MVESQRETVDQVLQQRNSDYAIVCDDLKKVYYGKDGNPDKYAVRGLSLALPYGECLGILGPNGAGKSSFISMVCHQSPLTDMLYPNYVTMYRRKIPSCPIFIFFVIHLLEFIILPN
jgi:ABC-type molybdenum transport system ATPase subunit/photorepair protein PhrA